MLLKIPRCPKEKPSLPVRVVGMVWIARLVPCFLPAAPWCKYSRSQVRAIPQIGHGRKGDILPLNLSLSNEPSLLHLPTNNSFIRENVFTMLFPSPIILFISCCCYRRRVGFIQSRSNSRSFFFFSFLSWSILFSSSLYQATMTSQQPPSKRRLNTERSKENSCVFSGR